MKKVVGRVTFSTLLILSGFVGFGQQWHLENEISLHQATDLDVSINRNIFVGNKKGEVIKFDSQGKNSLIYSPSKTGAIENLEAWSPFKTLVFYNAFQEAVILNRFLAELARYDLQDFDLGFISLLSLNFEQNFWVVDESDFSLKLIDKSTKRVIVHQPFNQFLDINNHEIVFLREYQNKLYVVDREFGILIFDNLGNLLDNIEVLGIQGMGFDDDSYFYHIGSELYIKSLYMAEESALILPKSDFQFVYKSGEYIYCLAPNQLLIYRYLSGE